MIQICKYRVKGFCRSFLKTKNRAVKPRGAAVCSCLWILFRNVPSMGHCSLKEKEKSPRVGGISSAPPWVVFFRILSGGSRFFYCRFMHAFGCIALFHTIHRVKRRVLFTRSIVLKGVFYSNHMHPTYNPMNTSSLCIQIEVHPT